MIKRVFVFWLFLSATMSLMAQSQQGYVKTKGRLTTNGKVIKGSPVAGAAITVKGRNAVVSGSNGKFSLTVPSNIYYLQKVQKLGYVLTDPDVLNRQYEQSKSPLEIVMEDKAQQEADRRALERRISSNLYAQLQKRGDELEALKEQNQITEEKYRELLQKLNQDQDDNEKIIKEMADRYSKIDFDQVDDFNRRISDLILNGRLTEADSLLRTKGDLGVRRKELDKHHEANQQKRAELKKSEKIEQRMRTDLANDYYTKFEICKMLHQNDSAAYYLEQRASLDNTNVEWLTDAGLFIENYIADYDLALKYYEKSLQTQLKQHGEQNDVTATAYVNIGSACEKKGDYSKALEFFQKALHIRERILDSNHPNTTETLNNIGAVYYNQGEYAKALDYFLKVLEIEKQTLGETHIYVATDYNNIGELYQALGDYEKALEFDNHALAIRKQIGGEKSMDVATSLNNIGAIYWHLGDYSKALDYYSDAKTIREEILGDNHPDVAESYNNIGMAYLKMKNYSQALDAMNKALVIHQQKLGENHPSTAIDYDNIGAVYNSQKNYNCALEYSLKAFSIRKKLFGDTHPSIAISSYNLGTIFYWQKNYKDALDYYNSARQIWEKILPQNHPNLQKTGKMIEAIKNEIDKQ